MKPFLILQLRPEDAAADNEYEAFLRAGGLSPDQTHRIRMEQGDLPKINLDDYSGVVVGGGPYNVSDKDKPAEQREFESWLDVLLKQIIAQDFPYLGACYGLGALTKVLGEVVSKEQYGEAVGAVDIRLTDAGRQDVLFKNIAPHFKAFTGHKESSQAIPEDAILLASSSTCPVQAIRVKDNIYATQFHPELDSKGLEVRINIYRYAGYFHPDEADTLIAATAEEVVEEPEKIFRTFINLYQKTAE